MPDTLPAIALFFIATGLVLFLPGAAWLAWAGQDRQDPLEWIAEAAGLSLAITAVGGGLAFYAGFQPGLAGFVGFYALALLVWLGGQIRRGWQVKRPFAGLLALAALLILAAWRLFQARSLALPAWVDSVHHTLLVRLILENGGLPATWMPYLPVPFFYHFGFHLAAASFAAWSQLELPQVVLVLGQLVSALVGLSIYRLAKTLWGDWKKAGLAALLVGFVFTMPAYYLTWGRVTLLTGLAVLPLAVSAALELRRAPASRWNWARLILYTTGIFFCHYLAAALFGLFLLLLGLEELVLWLRRARTGLPAWQPWAGAAAGTLLALPWLLRVWQYSQGSASVSMADPLDPASQEALKGAWDYTFYLLGPVRSQILLGVAGLGAAWLLWRGQGRLLAAWGLVLAFLATPIAPRFAPFRQDHFAIILFLPAALLAACLLVDLTGLLQRLRWKFASSAALGFAALGLLGWGLVQTADVLNSATVFTTRQDLAALEWLANNTPAKARFFINGSLWQGVTYRGLDGGYWIMPFSGRFTAIVPAAIAMGDSQTIQQYAGWGERVSKITACDDLFWSLVKEMNLDYAYLREGTGGLTPQVMDACQGVETVFSQEGVHIYRLNSLP